MACLLHNADALFVHIPKCGGHWVEKVLDAHGIEWSPAVPLGNVCYRHGRRRDYQPASVAFTILRDPDSWLLSYWRFLLHGRSDWFKPGIDYPYREFGPPMVGWFDYERTMRDKAAKYLISMTEGVDIVIDYDVIAASLAVTLQELGYENVTEQSVAAVPPQNVTELKVEIGGGERPLPECDKWVNVDLKGNPHIVHDLTQFPWPFPDESVDAVYSSHCIEHLPMNFEKALNEIARICRVGAKVQIRVPAPHSDMAMVWDHKHVISPQSVENMEHHFPRMFWTGPRRPKLVSYSFEPSEGLQKARNDLRFLRGVSDQAVMRWIPGTAHECVYKYEIVANEYA